MHFSYIIKRGNTNNNQCSLFNKPCLLKMYMTFYKDVRPLFFKKSFQKICSRKRLLQRSHAAYYELRQNKLKYYDSVPSLVSNSFFNDRKLNTKPNGSTSSCWIEYTYCQLLVKILMRIIQRVFMLQSNEELHYLRIIKPANFEAKRQVFASHWLVKNCLHFKV